MRKPLRIKTFGKIAGRPAEGIVLRKIGTEYVTHRFQEDDRGNHHYFWGHYFRDLEKARADFDKRSI